MKQQGIFRDQKHGDRNIMAKAILASEHVEKFSYKKRLAHFTF